ncbi:hypothetical protein PCC7418_1888 [Halothece sp. PCC 7418]|uniref:DUF4922 domain-containing protein n=1 Tax=Halothece sp. (strain PCC 7418) TaxID=65093 RepID=UPI0002A06E42|nr:DUF4922 domain-containing protein [Halothece sp. PCC 7418]AFZ44056.1 hypothetical protein PCC7418_1888 [Halothece sp. PCC 7418]
MYNLTTRLYQSWHQAVANDRIMSQFEATFDDESDGEKWKQGDRISYGIKRIKNELSYYAINETQSRVIPGEVEEKLINTGNIARFICQFNGYRALRPGGKRRKIGRQPDISGEASKCRFFCQNLSQSLSLLNRRPLVQVSLKHFVWNAYHNVAPLEKEGHFLWIPIQKTPSIDHIPHFPQRLSLKFLEDLVDLFQKLDQTILFFNSLHAGASVNHIHFQAVYHQQTLPLEIAPTISKPSGEILDFYPLFGLVFSKNVEINRLWNWIYYLQEQEIPFNLTLLGERIILVPRNPDHEIVSEFPGDSIAALGVCGKLVTVDRATYTHLNADKIESGFTKMILPIETL